MGAQRCLAHLVSQQGRLELRVDNLYRVPLKFRLTWLESNTDVAERSVFSPEVSQVIGCRVWGKKSRKSLQAGCSQMSSPEEVLRWQ